MDAEQVTLENRIISLRFSTDEAEREFLRQARAKRIPTIRIAAISMVLIAVAYILSVSILIPQSIDLEFILSAIIFSIPVIGSLIFSLRADKVTVTHHFAAATILMGGLAAVYMMAVSVHDPLFLIAMVLVINSFGIFVFGLLYRTAFWVTSPSFLAASVALTVISWDQSLNIPGVLMVFLAGWASALVGAHIVELRERQAFLLQLALERSNEDLSRLANTDPLTGLMNRRHFIEDADRSLASVRRYGGDIVLILFDIDYFKNVNDRLGHAVGDEALKTFAELLRRAFRTTDLIGRYGGEEFVILLEHTDIFSAVPAVERFLEQVAQHAFPQIPWAVTCSAGAAAYDGICSLDTLLVEADQRLYQSKDEGRNRLTI